MTRPAAIIGFSLFTALITSPVLGKTGALISGCICLLALFGFFLFGRKRAVRKRIVPAAALLSAALACFLYFFAYILLAEPYIVLDGVTCEIEGQLLSDCERDNNRYYYQLQVEKATIDGATYQGFKTRLSTSAPLAAEPYDRIEATVTFYLYQEAFGGSSRSYRLAHGMPIGAYLSGYSCTMLPVSDKPLGFALQKIKRQLSESIHVSLRTEEAAVIAAMLLGDRNQLEDTISTAFRKSGVSHFLVVSGMHMAILTGLLLALFRILRVRKVWASLLTIPAVLLFMLLTGLQPSVTRSGIMMLLFLLGEVLGRKPDSMNSLGIALIVMCLSNPFIGGDTGFTMSVMATVGIIVLSPGLGLLLCRPSKAIANDRLRRGFMRIMKALAVNLSAVLFVMPVQILSFGSMSLFSPIASMLLLIPMTLLMYCGIAAMLFGLLPILTGISEVFFLISGSCARFILFLTERMSDLLQVQLNDPFMFCALAVILIAVALNLLMRTKLRVRIYSAALCGCIFAAALFFRALYYQDVLMVSIASDPAGYQISAVQNGEAVILSCGTYTEGLLKTLEQSGVKQIQLLVTELSDRTSERRLQSISREYTIERLYLKEGSDEARALRMAKPAALTRYHTLTITDVLPGLKLQVGEADEVRMQINEDSLVLLERADTKDTGGVLIQSGIHNEKPYVFTIITSDDIMEYGIDRTGMYLLLDDYESIHIDFFPNGNMKLRRTT